MRKKMKSDERVPFDELFFVGDFGHPLAEANAGALAAPLQMATLRDSIVTVTVKSELWIFSYLLYYDSRITCVRRT
jgi:hypothetical protein